jgi:voltage-gated sodium channel
MLDKLRKFLQSDKFHYYVFGVILFNALVLGLQTIDSLEHRLSTLLDNLELMLVIFFILEVVFRAIANGKKFFSNGWDVFDLIIVCLCVFPHFRSLSVLRTFRVLEKLPHMSNILSSIRGTSIQILIVILIMFVLFYTFGVIGVRLYGVTAPVRFAGLEWAFLSLAQIMVGDAYGEIIRNVVLNNPSGWIYFTVVTVMFTFVVVNLFIGVVVGAIQSAVNRDEIKYKKQSTDALKELLQRLDRIEDNLRKKEDDK